MVDTATVAIGLCGSVSWACSFVDCWEHVLFGLFSGLWTSIWRWKLSLRVKPLLQIVHVYDYVAIEIWLIGTNVVWRRLCLAISPIKNSSTIGEFMICLWVLSYFVSSVHMSFKGKLLAKRRIASVAVEHHAPINVWCQPLTTQIACTITELSN